MEELEKKKIILKAIRNALANISLESDSLIDYNKITEDEIEKIYKKLVIKNGKF